MDRSPRVLMDHIDELSADPTVSGAQKRDIERAFRVQLHARGLKPADYELEAVAGAGEQAGKTIFRAVAVDERSRSLTYDNRGIV